MANVGLFAVHRIFSEYTESINSIKRICGKNLWVYREHVKSLSACSLATPRNIKVCISQLVIIQILKFVKSFHLNHAYGMD